ncbi:MAG: hypothetical protein SGBAC_003584 [Bacillariaceae sp.]
MQQTSTKDRAAEYRREFEELIQLAENGEQLTPDEDDRLYCLELFARQKVGEVLNEDEKLDLDDWLQEENEKETARKIEENSRDNTKRAGNNRNTQEECSESLSGQGDELITTQLMAPKLWESSTSRGSDPMAGSQTLWRSSTRVDSSPAMREVSSNQSHKNLDANVMEFLQQPEMVESENSSDSKQSETRSIGYEEEGDQHQASTPARVPMEDDASPQSPNWSGSPPEHRPPSKQNNTFSKEKEAQNVFGEPNNPTVDDMPLDWGDDFGPKRSPWDEKNQLDWGDGFGDDPFGEGVGFGDFDGFGGKDSEQDDAFGKKRSPLAPDPESMPADYVFGEGFDNVEDNVFGGSTSEQDDAFVKAKAPLPSERESKPVASAFEGENALGNSFGGVKGDAFGGDSCEQGDAFGKTEDPIPSEPDSKPADSVLEGDDALGGNTSEQDEAFGNGKHPPELEPKPANSAFEGENAFGGSFSDVKYDPFGGDTSKVDDPLPSEPASKPADSAFEGDNAFGGSFSDIEEDACGGGTSEQDAKAEGRIPTEPVSKSVDAAFGGGNAFEIGFNEVDVAFGGNPGGQDGALGKTEARHPTEPRSKPADAEFGGDYAFGGSFSDVEDDAFGASTSEQDGALGKTKAPLPIETVSNPTDAVDVGDEMSEEYDAFGKMQDPISPELKCKPEGAAFDVGNAFGGGSFDPGGNAFGGGFGCAGAGYTGSGDFGVFPSLGDDFDKGNEFGKENENQEWHEGSIAEEMEEQNDDLPKIDSRPLNGSTSLAEKQEVEGSSQHSCNAVKIDEESDGISRSERSDQATEDGRIEITGPKDESSRNDASASSSQVPDSKEDDLTADVSENDTDIDGRVAHGEAASRLPDEEEPSVEIAQSGGGSFSYEDGQMSIRQEADEVALEQHQEIGGLDDSVLGSSASFEGNTGSVCNDVTLGVNDVREGDMIDYGKDGNSQSSRSPTSHLPQSEYPASASSRNLNEVQDETGAGDSHEDLCGIGDSGERDGIPIQSNDNSNVSQNSDAISISNMSQFDDWSDVKPPPSASDLLSPQSIRLQTVEIELSSAFDDVVNHVGVPDREHVGHMGFYPDTEKEMDSITADRTRGIDTNTAAQNFDAEDLIGDSFGLVDEIRGEEERETEIPDDLEATAHPQSSDFTNQKLPKNHLHTPLQETNFSGDESNLENTKDAGDAVVQSHARNTKIIAPGWAGLLAQSSRGQASENMVGGNGQTRIRDSAGSAHGHEGALSNHEEQATQSDASEIIGEEEKESITEEVTRSQSEGTFESQQSGNSAAISLPHVSPTVASGEESEALENEKENPSASSGNIGDGYPSSRNQAECSVGDGQPIDPMRKQTASSDGNSVVSDRNAESAVLSEQPNDDSLDQAMGEELSTGSPSFEDNASGSGFASSEAGVDLDKMVPESEADRASFHSDDTNSRSSASQNVVLANEKHKEGPYFKSSFGDDGDADDGFSQIDSTPGAWVGDAPGFGQHENMDAEVTEGPANSEGHDSEDSNGVSEEASQTQGYGDESQRSDSIVDSPKKTDPVKHVTGGQQATIFNGRPRSSYDGDADKSIDTSFYLGESSRSSDDAAAPLTNSADDWSDPIEDVDDDKPQDERGPPSVESQEIENVNNNSDEVPNPEGWDRDNGLAFDGHLKIASELSDGFNQTEPQVKRNLQTDVDSQSGWSQHSSNAASSKEACTDESWDPHGTFQIENKDPELSHMPTALKTQGESSNSSHSWSELDEAENAVDTSIQSSTRTNGRTNRSISHSTKMSTDTTLHSQVSFPDEFEQESVASTRSASKELEIDGAESIVPNAQQSTSRLQLSTKLDAQFKDQEEASMYDEKSVATNGAKSTRSETLSRKNYLSEDSIYLGEVFGKSESFFLSDDKIEEEPNDKEDKKANEGLKTIEGSKTNQFQYSQRSVSQRSKSQRSKSQHKTIAQHMDETRSPSVKKKKAFGGRRSPSWRKAKINIDRRMPQGKDKRDKTKPRRMRTQKEIEERKKKRRKRKRVKKEAKSPSLLAFVASVNSAMLELEKLEEERQDQNPEETSAHQLLNGFDALMGIFLQLSDEIELMSTFAALKKKKDNDTITSYHALKEVLSFAESLDQLFADLKPIVLDCFEEEPDEEMEDMLFRLNSLVDLLCETSHRVGEKQEWNDRAETTYVTLLELMELETLELQCYFEDVDVPEQGISDNIHEAWSATGHMEELQALQLAANDQFLFRQICYEVMVSTDQWCPDVDTLMEICDIDPEILEEEPDPEYLEEEDLAPIPRAAEHILDKINGDPLPRSESLAAILRRILPPRAMTDLTLLDNFTSIRNTLDNPLGLSATNLVAITSAPEVLNDPSALGVAGVGKTTLAAMVAEHADVRRYFIDGVVWIYVGDKELTYSRYTQCLRDLVAQLDFYDGVPLFAELIHTPGECLTKRRRREEGFMIYARDTIVELLEDRSVLIILDDVCFEPDLDWFDFAPMPDGSQDDQGTDVALLVSTRARDLLPAADTVEVDMLDEDDAIALLIQESGQLSHTLMAESKETRSVVRECANHPLAVKSVGRWLGLKHVTAGAVSSAEDIHSEVVKSMEKILKGGDHSGTDMMYEILSLSLSPAINGEATNIIKYCFAAFVIVFCDKAYISEFAMTEPTPIVPMDMAQLLFETLLEINESALLQEGSLFYAQKKEAAVLIPEALSALGVLKVGAYSDADDEEEELDGDQKFLQVVHSIHHEYGEYLCFEEPALKMLTRDAEQEWNRALAEASMNKVEKWDENLDDAGHGYVLEMIVSHMIRGAMYNEASDLLANKGFVRGRLMSLGRECATRRHIKDCVLLSTKLNETRSKISNLEQRSVMKRAYQSLGSQLAMEYDVELVEDPRIKDIEIARSHYEIGFSLAENRCWDAAIAHWESSQRLLENALGTVEVVAGIMFNVSVSYSEMNEYDQALNAMKQCLRIRGAIHGEQHILYAQTIQKIGDIFLGMSDYNEAVESYGWALEVMNREPTLHRVEIGEILDNKGSIHRSKGELEESLKCHQEALRSKQMDLGEDHPELVVTYQHIGNCLSEQGNDDDAIVHLEEAIRLKELDLDGGAEGESDILTLEGFINYIERNQEQGLECYEKALQILVTKAPYRKEKIASLLHLIGCVYLTSGEHKKAKKLFEESLRARRKVLGFVHLEVASTLFNMAFLYQSRNRLDKALKCLEEALKIRALRLPETETVAMTHEKIGSLCRAVGKMKKAQAEFENALRLRNMIHGRDHIKVASVLQELGDLMDDIGEYDQALSSYIDALDIRRTKLGIEDVAVAETLYSMGYTLHNNDEPVRALVCLDESLKIRKYQLGDDSKEVGDTLNMMGFLKAKRGDLEQALTILWDALRIRKKQKDKIKVSETLNNIGNVHREKQDYNVAVQCYEECLRIRRTELGDGHEKVADSLIALGNVYGDTKKSEEAMQAYQEALKVRTKVFGERDERVATVLQYMGTMEFRSGNQDRARDLFTEFIKIRKENNATNDSEYVNVLFTIGNIHKLQGNQAQARQCWTEAYQVFQELGLEETNPQIASMMNDLLRMEIRDDDKVDQRRNAALSFFGKMTKMSAKDPAEPNKNFGGKNRQNGNAIQL